MNKQMREQLEAVVHGIVESDTEGAKKSFHEYLRMKTQEILLGEKADEEEDEDEDKDMDKNDKKVDKDLEKVGKDVKKAKKDQKKDEKEDKDCE